MDNLRNWRNIKGYDVYSYNIDIYKSIYYFRKTLKLKRGYATRINTRK